MFVHREFSGKKMNNKRDCARIRTDNILLPYAKIKKERENSVRLLRQINSSSVLHVSENVNPFKL